MAIGERIGHIMTQSGLNYRTLAATIGYSDMAVSNVVKGKSVPRYDMLIAIIEKFPKYSTYWLMTGKGDPEGKEAGVLNPSDIAIYVVDNQSEFLQNRLFIEFIEKLTFKRMLEIEKGAK